ncbi:MAG: hypothetical protein IVW57_06790 [Ktedonobacterales bacterium]|nr:hypothetical protein [Ktedonobacterales bacterium]
MAKVVRIQQTFGMLLPQFDVAAVRAAVTLGVRVLLTDLAHLSNGLARLSPEQHTVLRRLLERQRAFEPGYPAAE